jgi:hypothetical protein
VFHVFLRENAHTEYAGGVGIAGLDLRPTSSRPFPDAAITAHGPAFPRIHILVIVAPLWFSLRVYLFVELALFINWQMAQKLPDFGLSLRALHRTLSGCQLLAKLHETDANSS